MNEEERLRILELLEQTEGGDLPPFAVEEINKIFEKYKDLPLPEGWTEHHVSEAEIKLKMMDEPDWRKRSQMAAFIISNNIEI